MAVPGDPVTSPFMQTSEERGLLIPTLYTHTPEYPGFLIFVQVPFGIRLYVLFGQPWSRGNLR